MDKKPTHEKLEQRVKDLIKFLVASIAPSVHPW